MKVVTTIAGVLLLTLSAYTAEQQVSGVVTYMTSSQVYTSLGRDAGVRDSVMLYVVSSRDTVASLRVTGVSAKSSVCRVLESRGKIVVGATVVGVGLIEEAAADSTAPPPVVPAGAFAVEPARRVQKSGSSGPFEFKGRVSAQFFGTRNDQSAYDVSQPGLVVNMKVRSTDVPLTLDLYTNMRTLAYGTESPFSSHSVNQTRIYRLAVGYDDGSYAAALGRFSPASVPSIGYIDGLLLSTSVERFSFGAAGGFRPSYSQRGVSTDYKKFVLFTGYSPDPSGRTQMTLAYSRTYYMHELDREAASIDGRMTLSSAFSLFAHADFDLRRKSGNEVTLSPNISQIFFNVSYRVLPALGLGLNANATRPLYPYSALRALPEEMIDSRLRGGIGISVHVYFPAGISLTNTYTPRTSETGFADNYTEYAVLSLSNIATSGLSVRTNFNMNESEYARGQGYGVSLAKGWWNMFDLTLRYQQNQYTVKRIDETGRTSTFGADLLIPITRELAFTGTYEHLTSAGVAMNTIFMECSVRF